jgi:hypothetical protein
MDIDWTQVRNALKRIESRLAEAQEAIERTDAANDWPEVSRSELEAAFPRWREEYGRNWMRDFMEKRIGAGNYRTRRGSRKYRIAPEVLAGLPVGPRDPEPSSAPTQKSDPEERPERV